jgi:hypothetical protein
MAPIVFEWALRARNARKGAVPRIHLLGIACLFTGILTVFRPIYSLLLWVWIFLAKQDLNEIKE